MSLGFWSGTRVYDISIRSGGFFLISTILLLSGCGHNSNTKSRYFFNPPLSYHMLEVGPFSLYGDNEYMFNMSKLKMDRQNQVMIYYSFSFSNEDPKSHKALLEATSLELDIWNGRKIVYSFKGCIPFGEYGGKRLPNGEWGFGIPKEKLLRGDCCLSGKEINQNSVGRLRIKSKKSLSSSNAKPTVTICLKELISK